MNKLDNESSVLRSKYLRLRDKLGSLNYPTNFGIDAAEVVDQLLSDLISTTDSFKDLYAKEKRLQEDFSHLQAQVFPIRKDNNKLIKENLDLHRAIVKVDEELNKLKSDYSLDISRLEDNNAKLKRLCDHKDFEIRTQIDQYDKLREVSP